MAKIIQDIKLEVAKPNKFQAILAKQYDDDSRFLKVTFVNDGEKIEIHKTSKAVINANRIDGASKSYEGVSNNDGTATVPINSWMLELEGNLYCDVTIIDSEGRKLTSTSFTVLVEKSASGDISASPDADILVSLIEEFDSKANIYEHNDEIRGQGVASISFVVSEEAEKKGVTIVNNNHEQQYIDYITVDGGEYYVDQMLEHGVPFNFRLTEESGENIYDLWKAGAECEIHFSPAYALELLDVSVFVPKKVDVKDCYDISKEAISESKKIDFLGLGVNRVVPSMYSDDLSFKSPYGDNCDVTLDITYGDTGCVPTNISINGYDFVIRSDWYNHVAGCQINYIDLYQNKLYYVDGDDQVLENLYATSDGVYTPADAFGMNGGELEISFYDSNFDYDRPFDIIFKVNMNNGNGTVKPETPFGTAEEWTFTLEDGSTVTKKVVLC